MRRATRCAGQRLYWVPNGYIGTLSLCLSGPSRWRPPQVAPVARQGGAWISQTCELLMYLDIGEAPGYLRRMKNLVDSFLS